MKQIVSAFFCLILLVLQARTQQVIRLYKEKAPGSENWTQKESEFTSPPFVGLMVRNVVDPTLKVFKPARPNGTAVIVCPGGGFHWLSYQTEGTEVAEWLAARGVTAFVLKYRLADTGPTMDDMMKAAQDLMKYLDKVAKDSAATGLPRFPESMTKIMPLAVADGAAAVKYVREHATDFSINPGKIGMIGFSAGAWVQLGTIMKGDSLSQPNFGGHIYGGDTGGEKIPANAPPLFILSAADDAVAKTNPDLMKQWKAAGKSVELHIYSTGGHGFGMQKKNLPIDTWIERFGDWLKLQGFMN